MMQSAARTWLPALLLAILVGTVFGVLQGQGPESVLRKFHVSAVNGDVQGMNEVSVPNARPQALLALRNEITSIARVGGTYDVYRIVQGEQNSSVAMVNYSVSGQTRTYLYVLKLQGRRWLVDPEASINLMLQKFGPPRL